MWKNTRVFSCLTLFKYWTDVPNLSRVPTLPELHFGVFFKYKEGKFWLIVRADLPYKKLRPKLKLTDNETWSRRRTRNYIYIYIAASIYTRRLTAIQLYMIIYLITTDNADLQIQNNDFSDKILLTLLVKHFVVEVTWLNLCPSAFSLLFCNKVETVNDVLRPISELIIDARHFFYLS